MDILLSEHILLQKHPAMFHSHFTIYEGLFISEHSLLTYLNHALVIVAFSDNSIVAAVRPECQFITIYGGFRRDFWYVLSQAANQGDTKQHSGYE